MRPNTDPSKETRTDRNKNKAHSGAQNDGLPGRSAHIRPVPVMGGYPVVVNSAAEEAAESPAQEAAEQGGGGGAN